ncbi:hypothetical protein BC833DRAFT_607719 [Globomyces pollinis-pini]|nr:hypothetical protein BC833DRAFT_607719 [Globomyces pollinis-pini]
MFNPPPFQMKCFLFAVFAIHYILSSNTTVHPITANFDIACFLLLVSGSYSLLSFFLTPCQITSWLDEDIFAIPVKGLKTYSQYDPFPAWQPDRFKVTIRTRIQVANFLQLKGLSMDISDLILDYAECWNMYYHFNSLKVVDEGRYFRYIVTNPIPDLRKCIKIIVEISSREKLVWNYRLRMIGLGGLTGAYFSILNNIDGNEERWEAYKHDSYAGQDYRYREQTDCTVRVFDITRVPDTKFGDIGQFRKSDSFMILIGTEAIQLINYVEYCKVWIYYK